MEEKAFDYAVENPIIPTIFAFSLSVLAIIAVLVWLYVKVNKTKDCNKCDVMVDRDFYKTSFGNQQKYLTESTDQLRDIRQEQKNQEFRDKETKTIIHDIAAKMENITLTQNKIATILDIILRRSD